MVAALLDTSIIIDIIRHYPPAVEWLRTTPDLCGLTWFTWLEVIEGCQNKRQERAVIKVLNDFELIPIEDADAQWATRKLIELHLKSNVDMIDCLIAAPSHRLQIPTYTRNMKHFTPLLDELAVLPYSLE